MTKCVCVWGENWNTTESRNRSLRWEEAAGSLSSKARACEERCRRAWERVSERVKERARFCNDVDIFVGNSGLYAYAIIMKQRSTVQFVFVFLSAAAAADLIWIRFKSAQALYSCCCFIFFFLSCFFLAQKLSTGRKHFSGHASGVI